MKEMTEYCKTILWVVLLSGPLMIYGQNEEDFTSPYRDTSFRYEMIDGKWKPDTRTIDHLDEYGDLLMRVYQKRNKNGVWKTNKRTKYTRNQSWQTIMLTEEFEDGQWKKVRKYTYEYFPNSHEFSKRIMEKWDEETGDWKLDYRFERTYKTGTRIREDVSYYYSEDGTLRNAQRDVIQQGTFGEEEVKEVYRKGENDSIWEPLSRTQQIEMGDSLYQERQRWDEEKGGWGEPVNRTVKTYYREDEWLPTPVLFRGNGRTLKERKSLDFEEDQEKWTPKSRETIEYEERDSGYIKRNTKFEWDPTKQKWQGLSRTTIKYDHAGHSRGNLREQYDGEEGKWIPKSRSRHEPGEDGYLHSIRQEWNKEKGSWEKSGKRRFRPCYPVSPPDRV